MARAWLGPLAGLAALLAGIALGALFPGPLAPVGAAVRAAFGAIALAAPLLIFATIVPAVAGLLRSRVAGRFAAAVVVTFLAGSAAAGLLAALLLVPAFQLDLAPRAGVGGATLGPSTLLLGLTSQAFTAVWYGALVGLILEKASGTRLRGAAAPTLRVLTRVGVDGVEALGRALRRGFPALLFLVGIYLPLGAAQAVDASSAALAGAGPLAQLGGASPVAWYFVSVLAHAAILAVLAGGAIVLACKAARFPLRRFLRDYFVDVFPFAWATASSAATIPVNLERARDGLGVRSEVRDFIMPLGATVNRQGSLVSAMVLTVVAALLVGHRPSLVELLALLLPMTLVVSSAPPVPAGTAVVAPPVAIAVLALPPGTEAAFAAIFFAFGVGLSDQLRTGINAVSNGWYSIVFERAFPRLARSAAGSMKSP